jgi:nucleoside-diphosphate-sugar epimerase
MKRVLLTGARGFVGRHCLPALLAQGYQVHAVASQKHAPPPAPSELRWHQADLLDRAETSALLAESGPVFTRHGIPRATQQMRGLDRLCCRSESIEAGSLPAGHGPSDRELSRAD